MNPNNLDNSSSKKTLEYLNQPSFINVENKGQRIQWFVEGPKANQLPKEISNKFQRYNDDSDPHISERVIDQRTDQ